MFINSYKSVVVLFYKSDQLLKSGFIRTFSTFCDLTDLESISNIVFFQKTLMTIYRIGTKDLQHHNLLQDQNIKL